MKRYKCWFVVMSAILCGLSSMTWAGDGTEGNPYTVAEAVALPTGATEFWAQGYIVGGRYDDFDSPWVNDFGVSVADVNTETDVNNCLQLKLESDGGRDAWGLSSNPGNVGSLVKFQGFRDTYGGFPSFEGVDNADISLVSAGATTMQFSATGSTAGENAGQVTISVIRSDSTGTASAQIQLSGTANGSDYTFNAADTNVTFADSVGTYDFVVTIVDDGDQEDAETILLDLVNISGADAGANLQYTLTIGASDGAGSTLIISEVADPLDNFNGRFVELYNLGGSPIDLAAGTWYLGRQTGDSGSWADIALTGTVAAGSTYVIASSTNFSTFYPSAPASDQTSGNVTGNGDDGYFLFSGGDHSVGTLQDAYGVIDQDGTGQDWEYLDSRAVRDSGVTAGNVTWTASEWDITADANLADMTPGVYPDGPPVIVTNVRFTASADSISEAGATYAVTVIKTLAEGTISGQVQLGGTATLGGGNDYTIDTTNFVMDGATTSATFTITLNDDGDIESSETVTLDLVNVAGGTIATPSTFTLTITDNDSPAPTGGAVWINEIDYDNVGTDSNEYFEVAGAAGIDLSIYSVVLYNGSGGVPYRTNLLSGIIDDEGCGFGAVSFYFGVNDAIQQGPDAIALVSNGVSVVEFLSYEGSFTAVGGPANGLTPSDIGVSDGNTTEGSVQLGGSGSEAADFTWEFADLSPGDLNLNQTIDPCGGSSNVPPVLASVGNKVTQEGVALAFAVTATPTDGDTVTLTVSNAPAGSVFGSTNEVGTFTWASPAPVGVYTTTFYAADVDGVDSETITITVQSVPSGPNYNVWFNEIHYENIGGDTNEGFEIAGEAGINLADFKIYLYDAGGLFYDVRTLSGTIPDEQNGFGAVWIDYETGVGGFIQNGPNDGYALVYEVGATTNVIQFLSTEGSLFAVDGPVAFSSSTDIGVQEDGTTVTGDQSLQLCGTGTNYAEMLSSGGWQAPALNSRGLLQACQTIPGGSGDTTLDEFDVTDLVIGGTLVSVDIDVSSNGVPYSLIYSTNLLTDPEGTGTADTQNGNGGSITLQDDITGKDFRIYWIRSN